jgi:hypothetical protein
MVVTVDAQQQIIINMKQGNGERAVYSLNECFERENEQAIKKVAFLKSREANPVAFFSGSTCFNFLQISAVKEGGIKKKRWKLLNLNFYTSRNANAEP